MSKLYVCPNGGLPMVIVGLHYGDGFCSVAVAWKVVNAPLLPLTTLVKSSKVAACANPSYDYGAAPTVQTATETAGSGISAARVDRRHTPLAKLEASYLHYASQPRVRGRLKIRHSLRSGCPCGQRYSLACSSHSKSPLDSVPSLRCFLSHTGTCG
jgi:hypothetical protein